MKHLTPLKYIDAVAKAGSIRKAADSMAITSTALNRRILAMEKELGVQLFERLPKGVRLSSAGELFLHHIRVQISDLEKVKSQISDLKGERRGVVRIAGSQATLTSFLPQQIYHYRKDHPMVDFEVLTRDRAQAEQSLLDHTADLALVFEPVQLSDVKILLTVKQPVYALMSNKHELANKSSLRLRECLNHPIAMPTAAYGIHKLLHQAAQKRWLTINPCIKSDNFIFLANQTIDPNIITFQIGLGLPLNSPYLKSVPIDIRDVPPGLLYVGQLKGRTLPVASARFADQIITSLESEFDCS
jgi:DNA-binding transcriptional LysR family regulator